MSRLVIVLVLLGGGGLCLSAEPSTGSSNSTQGYVKNLTKDGLTKRGVNVEDISGKNYDPPPEYYRGPASSSHSSSSYNGERDNTVAGYPSRPVAFPDGNGSGSGNGKYGYKGGTWQSSNNEVGQQERKGLHDRVSVGHYGSGLSQSGYGNGNHGYGSSTTAHPYGPPQAVEYEYYVPTGNGHGYPEDGIPIELYNRGYGNYGGHGNYGHGGDYSTYTVTSGHDGGGGGGGYGHGGGGGKHGYDKALLAKSFLIPLASAAVLGIAAALASNPLLLQLGTVSSIGKRKRRELEEPIVHSMAYRRQRRN